MGERQRELVTLLYGYPCLVVVVARCLQRPLLAVGEELGAEVAGVVGDVGQDDDGLVSGAVESEVGGVAASLAGVVGDGLTGLPARNLPEVADAGVPVVGGGRGLEGGHAG